MRFNPATRASTRACLYPRRVRPCDLDPRAPGSDRAACDRRSEGSRRRVQAYFYERAPTNRLRRPSPFSYEEAVFSLPTFFTAIIPFRSALRGLQRLINAYFAGFRRHFIPVPPRCKVILIFGMFCTPRSCRRRSRISSLTAGNTGCERMGQSAVSNRRSKHRVQRLFHPVAGEGRPFIAQ